MKKLIYILCASFMMLFSSCCYEDEINDIYDHLEQLEGSKIPMLEQQIGGINASLTELNAVHDALRQLISELSNKQEELQNQIDNNAAADAAEKAKLEKELKDLKTLIASLQSKDEELTQQIEELQNYVNNEISGLHNWAEGTFATLEQYAQMQTELAAIKALIDNCGGNMEQLTQAISEAIETSEASMKTWVNNMLAEGYYDIAEIDGKLAALLAMIEEGDAELKKDIEDQKAALELAKAELTEAYKKAIEEAINNNNGAINKAIADAVQKALDKVETKLAVIENAIAAIQKDIENIKSSIASLEQQIESINASLTELNAVHDALRQLISELSNKQEELQNQIDNNAAADAAEKAKLEKELKDLKTLIASLQSKDEELTQQIEELQNYVNNEISGLHNWAEGTFATLEQYAQMQTELAAIKALIDNCGGNMEQLTQAISEAIETSEASMKTWVNNMLAEGYYDIAEIDAKLDALRSELTNADTEILKKLAAQQAALEQAKKQLTDAYEKAIAKAIEENNGVIDAKIESAVEAATSALQDQINAISSAIANMQAQLDMIASRIQSVTYIPQYSDGKIKFSYTEKTAEVYLRISPAALASKIETSMVKAFARYTDDPITRSLNDELPISVSLAAGDGTTGILHVCLAEDTANKLSDAFWRGDAEAIIYIQISDGNSNIVSPYIPVVAHGYVSNSADIGGFDDGSDTTGTVM